MIISKRFFVPLGAANNYKVGEQSFNIGQSIKGAIIKRVSLSVRAGDSTFDFPVYATLEITPYNGQVDNYIISGGVDGDFSADPFFARTARINACTYQSAEIEMNVPFYQGETWIMRLTMYKDALTTSAYICSAFVNIEFEPIAFGGDTRGVR